MTPDLGDHHAHPELVRIAPAPIDITREVGSANTGATLAQLKRSVAGDGESHEAAAPETVSRSTRDPRSFHPAGRAEPLVPARSAGAYPTAPLARTGAGVDPWRVGCLGACLASAAMVVAGLTWAIRAAMRL